LPPAALASKVGIVDPTRPSSSRKRMTSMTLCLTS
jgi:hypothetical protein